MSDQPKPERPSKEYAVGFGRPPVETRFQPGKSGNPRGKPKGVKSIGRLLVEALQRRITVQENGRQRRMRLQDVIVQGLVNDAARRDAPALKLLFALVDRYCEPLEQEGNAADLLPDDRAIIEAFLSSPMAARNAGDGKPEERELPGSEDKSGEAAEPKAGGKSDGD